MNNGSFECQIKALIPEFVLRQFRHILETIPPHYRTQFLVILRQEQNVNHALDNFSAAYPLKVWKQFMHQRMQDSIGEIAD